MNKINNLKAVVLDLDGTLLSSNLKVLEETSNTLINLKKNGIKIIIASGRTPQTAIPMTKSIDIKAPMVMANGALIFDPAKNEIIDSITISKETIKYFMNLSKEIKTSLNIYTPSCIYLDEDKIEPYMIDSGDKKENLINIDKLNLDNEIVVKCEFFGKNEGKNPKLKELVNKKSEEVKEDLYITTAHANYLEILNKKVNKFHGIKKVLKYYNIDDDEVLIFGDSHNDIEMLENFPHTVAMENAEPCAKNVAKYTTKSNNEDGIAHFIKNFTNLV